MGKLNNKKKKATKVLPSPEKRTETQLDSFKDNRLETTKINQLQGMANDFSIAKVVQQKKNNTGLPNQLKSGIENLSGYAMDDVKVHYNSDKPAQLNAHAYAQGTNIHIASGQEKHLPHEAWHVVQQKQGRVKPTTQLKEKVNINDDKGLEKEADVMGAKAAQLSHSEKNIPKLSYQKESLLDEQIKQKKATQNKPHPENAILQREEITGISGLTHLVRKEGDSIFKGEEFEGSEVTHEDTLVIEPSIKFRSRRGPNQELYEEMDKGGEHSYRWFKVLRLIKQSGAITDYAHDEVYVRDDALTLPSQKKGTRNTVINGDQRDRVDTMEEALGHLPEAIEPTRILDPGTAWNVAQNPEEYGYHEAIINFGNLWGVCGNANENLMIRLKEFGTSPKLVKKVDFIGAKGGVALAALLKLSVTETTIVQVANPQIHEFSLEIWRNGVTYLHQGYVKNFDAIWWAGLAQSESPHFTMLGEDAARIKHAQAIYGGLQTINRSAIANGLENFMAADVFCAAADEAWNLLPFPKEGNFARKGILQKEQLKFTVTAFQFENEMAAKKAIRDYERTPLIEIIMRDAASVLKKIQATKGKTEGKAAPLRLNIMAGVHKGVKLKKTNRDDK